MIDTLSPREYDDVVRAEAEGRGWACVLRCFLDGHRLLLGWDRSRSATEIAESTGLQDGAARDAIDEAVRWSVGHRLHLLAWQEPDDSWRYFLAVG